jgi:hypothetical protein
VARVSSAPQYRGIQLFAKLILYIFFYFTNTFNVGCHAEKNPRQKEIQDENVKCIVGY